MAKPDNIYDELKWRGLIHQESGQDEIRDYLINNKTFLLFNIYIILQIWLYCYLNLFLAVEYSKYFNYNLVI